MEELFMPERLGGKSRNAMTSHCMISDDGARTFMVHWVKHDLVIICFLKRMVLPPKKAQICTRYWLIVLDHVGLLLGHRQFVSFYKRNIAPHCNARFLNLGSHLLIPYFFLQCWFPFYGSHHLLRPHGTMQGKARRAVVPFCNPL